MTCRLEAGDWLYIPSGWWHIAQTQTEPIHLSIGVMPVVRLTLLEFLQHRLAQDPFWCQRLAWVPQAEAGGPAPTEQPPYLWEDMRAQLREVLAHEQTWQEFLAYPVDPRRALSGETFACQP